MEGQQHGDRLKRGPEKPSHSAHRAGRGYRHRPVSGERVRHSVRRPGYHSWLRYRRFYRFPDHASAGRNGGGRAGGRLI